MPLHASRSSSLLSRLFTPLTPPTPLHASPRLFTPLTPLHASQGPTTTKVKAELALDEEDIAVRGMMVLKDGEMMWPWTPPAPPPPPPKKPVVEVPKLTEEDYKGARAHMHMGMHMRMGMHIAPRTATRVRRAHRGLTWLAWYEYLVPSWRRPHPPLLAPSAACCSLRVRAPVRVFGAVSTPSSLRHVLQERWLRFRRRPRRRHDCAISCLLWHALHVCSLGRHWLPGEQTRMGMMALHRRMRVRDGIAQVHARA